MRDKRFVKWLGYRRREIDKTDLDLLRALRKRLRVAAEVGMRKFDAGIPIIDRKREEAVVKRARAFARRNKMDARAAADFMEFVMQLSREAQRKEFSRLCARKWF